MALTFWFEFSSPYSCLTARRIRTAADRAGVAVRWRAFLLGPIFAEAGYEGSPNLMVEAKARHMWRDVARRAHLRSEPFVRPATFPQKSVAAARATLALAEADRPAFVVAAFECVFGEGRDIADPVVMADAARAAGLDVDRVLAGASDPSAKAALFAAVDEAKALRIFGAPTFVCDDGELFWGDDRLDDALEWARSRALAHA